ncbi:MAG: hypothetical protein Q4G43_11305 [Mobilicoccus sp.]|nr:hypothetical protein [Mobilicoccus sp.]
MAQAFSADTAELLQTGQTLTEQAAAVEGVHALTPPAGLTDSVAVAHAVAGFLDAWKPQVRTWQEGVEALGAVTRRSGTLMDSTDGDLSSAWRTLGGAMGDAS